MKILCINLCAQGCLFTQFTLLEVQSLGSNVITFGNPDTHILPTPFLKVATAGYFLIICESADFLKERNCFPLPLAMHGTGAQKSILCYVQRPYDQNQSCRILEEKRERHFSLWEISGCPFMTCRWEARAQVSPRLTGPLGTSSCWGERWSLGLAKEMVHSNNGTFLWPLNTMRSGYMNSGGKMIRMNAKGSRKQNAKWRQGGHLRSVQVKGAYLLYSMPLWTMGGCF